MFLHKSHIWEKSGSWETPGQSECTIFTSTMSPDQNDEKSWFFFTCLYKFMKIKSWLEIFLMRIIKSGWCLSDLETKIGCSQEWVDWEWSDFFACWYKFKNTGTFNNLWTSLVKSLSGLLGHEILKSSDLKNEVMNWADFLDAGNDGIIFG